MQQQRQSHRMPVTEERQHIMLKLAPGQHLEGKLIDESAGGYCLEVPNPVPLAVGDVVFFAEEENLHEAEIRHLTEVADGALLRIGVKRIFDQALNERDDHQPAWQPWWMRVRSQQAGGGGVPSLGLPIFACIVTVAASGGLLYWFFNGGVKPAALVASKSQTRADKESTMGQITHWTASWFVSKNPANAQSAASTTAGWQERLNLSDHQTRQLEKLLGSLRVDRAEFRRRYQQAPQAYRAILSPEQVHQLEREFSGVDVASQRGRE